MAASSPPTVGRARIVFDACLGVMRAGARGLADTIIPATCVSCHLPVARHDTLCGTCWRDIVFIRPPLCDRLGLPMPYGGEGTLISAAAAADPPPYGRARAVAAYDGIMRQLIHGFKYADRHDARRLFGRWLVQAGAELLNGVDAIVPVPLNSRRLWHRQFNQAAMLAQELARLTHRPFDPYSLRRTRRTQTQVGLSMQQRRSNVQGAFAVPAARRGRMAGRNLLLVDDVITSGATVEACARAMIAVGAARVDVLALALVTDPRQVSP